MAPLDRAGEAMQLTTGGATEPVWGSGRAVLPRRARAWYCARVGMRSLGEPRTLFEGHFERDPGANLASYDVDPQGRFFIMLKSALQPRELRVVRNWGRELRTILSSTANDAERISRRAGSWRRCAVAVRPGTTYLFSLTCREREGPVRRTLTSVFDGGTSRLGLA